MLNGTVGADWALLVASAAEGEFEEGLRGQMREHARLAFYLGILRLIVAITKMDSCDWSEDRYNEIVTETKRILSKQGFNAEKTPYVPISGLNGDNISTAIDSPWYNGWPSTSKGVILTRASLSWTQFNTFLRFHPSPRKSAAPCPRGFPATLHLCQR